jgi:hypothetical protein
MLTTNTEDGPRGPSSKHSLSRGFPCSFPRRPSRHSRAGGNPAHEHLDSRLRGNDGMCRGDRLEGTTPWRLLPAESTDECAIDGNGRSGETSALDSFVTGGAPIVRKFRE